MSYLKLLESLSKIRDVLGKYEETKPKVSHKVKTVIPKDPKKLMKLLQKKDVKDIISRNCSLIKTVDKDKIAGIERRVKRIYEGTSTPDTLVRYLENECDVSPAHAELIARDQMQKAEAHFRLQQFKQQGVKLVKWVHGGSHEPRPWHIHKAPNGLNGLVFPIDQPPIIDKDTGERGYPGDLIGCKCHLEAVSRKSARN